MWGIALTEAAAYTTAVAATLTQLAQQHPDWELSRNDVGNWSLYDKDGEYVGWVSPPQGQVSVLDEPGNLTTGRTLLDLWGHERARQ